MTSGEMKIYVGIDMAKDIFDYCAMTIPSIFYAGEAIRKTAMKDSGNCQISSGILNQLVT